MIRGPADTALDVAPESTAETRFVPGTAAVGAEMIRQRNRNVGYLLLAERAAFYTHILYAMLQFRRDHELEPLYEDIFAAVHEDLDPYVSAGSYLLEQFRADMDQLQHWELVSSRIEIERLRGYRDTRKRKFRYSLSEEAIAFVEWLEDRSHAQSERPDDDARDVLEDISGVLNELLTAMGRAGTGEAREGDPRRVLYQLFKLEDLTLLANGHLGTFNARLLGFVIRHYDLGDAKLVLGDLEDFVENFLRQIHELRGSIVERVEKLMAPDHLSTLRVCAAHLEEDRRRAPSLVRHAHDLDHIERIPARLLEFYRENGKLDLLCRRIHSSSLKVWRKLHSHLRELERRSSRVEDLRERMAELAAMPEDAVPRAFLNELIAPVRMVHDPNYWDGFEKADPPKPRRQASVEREPVRRYLKPKKRAAGPVLSMEQARLEDLRGWLLTTLGQPSATEARHLSRGAFTEVGDFYRVMELSKAALLDSGKKLRRIRFVGQPEPADTLGSVELDDCRLSFRELMVRRLDDEPSGQALKEEPKTEWDEPWRTASHR